LVCSIRFCCVFYGRLMVPLPEPNKIRYPRFDSRRCFEQPGRAVWCQITRRNHATPARELSAVIATGADCVMDVLLLRAINGFTPVRLPITLPDASQQYASKCYRYSPCEPGTDESAFPTPPQALSGARSRMLRPSTRFTTYRQLYDEKGTAHASNSQHQHSHWM